MSYTQVLQDLTPEEKDAILYDLFACLRDDRLRDSVFGWRLTKKGNLAPRDSTWGTASSAAPPDWQSLVRVREMGAFE